MKNCLHSLAFDQSMKQLKLSGLKIHCRFLW